jgi:hypothetical protein
VWVCVCVGVCGCVGVCEGVCVWEGGGEGGILYFIIIIHLSTQKKC